MPPLLVDAYSTSAKKLAERFSCRIYLRLKIFSAKANKPSRRGN
jgi:hypothetical protein